MGRHNDEVMAGQRFEFGDNWTKFLSVLNEDRINLAEQSLKNMLGQDMLEDKTFLDIGSGSGLFSLAARRLGATVHSFDYDPQSVSCTTELKRRYFPDDSNWQVEAGSVLDEDYLARLGSFDVVYSWGVLHHTGSMWQALAHVVSLVASGGQLFIAIYNDQGGVSRRWELLKKIYNAIPHFLKVPYTIAIMGPREIRSLAILTLKGMPMLYFRNIANYKENSSRGMNYWRDIVDWVGGYPFEVAKPEEIFDFFKKDDFVLDKLKTCAGGHGCNEFVFSKK